MKLLPAILLLASPGAAKQYNGGRREGVPKGQYGGDNVSIATDEFEEFIRQQMKEWHVPGMAMAVVEGKATWSKGFGYAVLESEPVTPSTLFYCGSMTKSLTAAGLSILVDDPGSGRPIGWEDRLQGLLGDDFVLSDPWASHHITVEDALCHRTGYPRHDWAGPFGDDPVELMRALRNLPMSKEPRVKWQYSNMMYGVLGHLIERLSRRSLADFFRDRLWRPMGMESTYLHPDDAVRAGRQLARPYYYNNDTGTFGVLPWNDQGSVAGAGMAISSVLDWSRYLRHMIDETGPISKAGHAALKAPHMVSEQDKRIYSGTEFYGLGWASNMIQNEPVWYHSGRVSGMLSYMAFAPARKFGFVIFLNTESVPALDSIFSATLFNYFGVPKLRNKLIRAGWYEQLKDQDESLRNCSARLFPSSNGNLSRTDNSTADMDLRWLEGKYFNDGYGSIDIVSQCDGGSQVAAGSPALLTTTPQGCELVIRRPDLFGKRFSFRLQHIAGQDWLAWLFVDDYDTVHRPSGCYRAQVEPGRDGKPEVLGLDIRMEGDDVPLVRFRRV